MIEISLIPSNEIIYIDFGYSGIPEELNIEKIIIKESKDLVSKELEEMEDDEELEERKFEYINLENKDELDYDLTKPYDDDKLKEILLDDYVLEEEYEELYHTVNVGENEKRYTLETQMNDYIDNMLNRSSIEVINDDLINNIHMELNRYKELRELYSDFDENNNPDIINEKGEFYKPLKEILYNLNKKLYWILPVSYNSKYLFSESEELDEDFINKIKMGEFIENLNLIINKWSNSSSRDKINDYKTYINNLLSIYNNTSLKSTGDLNSIKNNNLDVNNQIEVINDMYDDFYSYSIYNNSIEKNRFNIEVLNEGMKMLETDYINNKRIYNLKKLTLNDKITLTSFITLPLSILNFSKINQEYTNIYTRANLNENFLNYYKLLNNDTNVNKLSLEEGYFDKIINTHNNIHNNTLFDNIFNFSIEDSNSITLEEKYNLLLESFIPTNKNIIEYLSKIKKYVNYKSLIEDLQNLNIDMYKLNVKDNKILSKLFKINIENYKKEYNNNKDLLNKLINLLNEEVERDKEKYKLNFDILNKELKEELLENYNIDIEIYNNNSELINSLLEIDGGKFFINGLNKNIMDLIVSNLLDNFIKQSKRSKENKELINKEEIEDKCEKYYLSKKYNSIGNLEDDNNKEIFFDGIYDNTVYSLINEYKNEKESMDNKGFFEFLTFKLMDIMNMTKKNALREARAIIEEKREVIDGDYALLVDKESNKNYIYVRSNSLWILDEKFKNDFYIDSNKILCDVNKECISINDKCIDGSKLEKKNLKEDIDKILDSFEAKYNLSVEEIKGKLNEKYENGKKYLKNIIKISKKKEEYVNDIMYRYSNIFSNFVKLDDNIKVSPYEKLLDKILSLKDFVGRQNLIKKFCIKFTRDSIDEEDNNWLYCNETSVKLIPKFLLKLANAFLNKEDYSNELDSICANQGTISDDNNYWVDKYSGYIIKQIDFSSDEGFDEQGYKLNTKEVLENEYKSDIKNLNKNNVSLNPDIISIKNIIKTVTQMIGINLDNQEEFIINNVISIQKANVPSKEQYEKMKTRTIKKESKSKINIPTYEDTYNQLLLLLTLSYIIVAIQINIPSLKTKKTFPGCIKSFSGYPFEGNEDKTSIIYIACVANKIKSSIKPWNTLLKISEVNLIKKIESIIENYIIKDKTIIELINNKKEYLLLNDRNGEDIIPDNLSINNWSNFMPALYDIKISKENTLPLADTFKDEILEYYTKGKKNNILETLLSKTIYLSNSIIESVINIVNKNSILLENSAGEGFLENSCCNSNINTIIYFINNDKSILENNKLVQYYSKLLDNINKLNKSSILYNNENSKILLPSINLDFSEETIYKTFIYYCNFNNNLPIDDELRSICMDKPRELYLTNNIIDNIELLKQEGKIYNKNSLDELINIINKRNIFIVKYNNPIINNIEFLRNIINNYFGQKLEDNIDEILFEKLFNLLDTYDINNNNNNKELDNIKNYLGTTNNIMKSSFIEFLKSTPNLSKSLILNIEKLLDFNIDINNCKFYEDYINNFVNIFPNIIINKNMEINNIPRHWELSEMHNKDIKNILDKYYKNLTNFSNKDGLDLIFKFIRNKCSIYLKLMKYIKYISGINISNSDDKDESKINSIFDEQFIKYFYKNIFYSIINEYINITKNQMFILDIGEYDNYDEELINNNIINYINDFLNIMNNHLDILNNNYNKVKEKITYAKEKEKDLITQYLKELTDEEREVENIFKNNKLEGWNAGLQKGLTQYIASNYDDERMKLEIQANKEHKLNNNNNVTEMNKEIYMLDIDENERIQEEIENEEYNMNNIPDDDDSYDDDDFYNND
tara:strand:+ start:5 stop:5449 length:5445 start_codon:yes stop_codon:yes gene_type:complete